LLNDNKDQINIVEEESDFESDSNSKSNENNENKNKTKVKRNMTIGYTKSKSPNSFKMRKNDLKLIVEESESNPNNEIINKNVEN